ncbi:MAG: MFS transporter [Pseudomonadota bacterium]
MVLAASLIHFWGAGTFFYSFTAFFNPIVDEFGWSYAATSFAASLRSIEGGIASPLVGIAADRYGARRLLIAGSILTGAGFILLSRIQTLWSYYAIFIVLSIASSMLFPVPGWTAAANWFRRHRGTALGILSAAIGVSGVLIYLVNWLIGVYGWRTTLWIIGIGMWVIGIPCSLVVRHRPEPYGLLPDGEKGAPQAAVGAGEKSGDAKSGPDEGYGLREALRTWSFWRLALIATLSSGAVHALMVHVMPYLISEHFSRNLASIVATLLVFSSTFGRLGMGWLTTRLNNRYLLALSLGMQAAGLVVAGSTRTLWQAILFVLLFGPGYGGVITLRLTLQAEYFGRKAFGSIQGMMMAVAIAGTMSFPFLAGLYYDLFGNYRLTWLMMAGIILTVIPLALKTSPPGGKRHPSANRPASRSPENSF